MTVSDDTSFKNDTSLKIVVVIAFVLYVYAAFLMYMWASTESSECAPASDCVCVNVDHQKEVDK